MSGFIYKNKSTQDIIGRKLLLCGFERVDSVIGVQRQNQIGEQTISRPIPNEYGTINDPLEFEYGLILDPCDLDSAPYITEEEQIIIERWLTSPKFSSNLYVINDNDEVTAIYCGKFTKTDWHPWQEGYIGVTFTFTNNSAYPKEICTEDFEFETSGVDWYQDVYCDSDELEEYVYPIITIVNPNATRSITITNTSDATAVTNSMTIVAEQNIPLKIDCKHCIVTNGNFEGVRFSELGWSDVGNIYWPRLLPGNNHIRINAPCHVTYSFEVVRKKVGGWL